MKNLLIIGARGFGREIYNLAKECEGYNTEFIIKGFLDDNVKALDGYLNYPSIISSVEDYKPEREDVFICALGDVYYKKKYVDIILSKGGNFINLIHPTAYISSNVEIGTGCIIGRSVQISCDVKIGNYVTLQVFVDIGHDCIIGDFCHLNSYTFMGGYVELEDMVTLHTASIIHPHKKVGYGGVVGAGAFVIRNVKNNTSVYGNPAILLK